MLLSACMIVKNEAQTIARCLSSLKDVADEVILVDTGSSDNTVEIAKSHGAKTYFFPWESDFSKARNESLKHALGQWILVIDADEYLDENQKKGLRSFLESTDAEGVFLTQKNYMGSLEHFSAVMPIQVIRLFRRGHTYQGKVHEQVAPSIERTKRPIVQFELDLHHVGYSNEFVRGKEKTERNSTLLIREMEDDPNNLFHRSNLIAEYVHVKEYRKSAELAKSTFSLIRTQPVHLWPNFVPRIFLHWTVSLWMIGKCEEAISTCKNGVSYFPWLTDLKKLYADMLAQKCEWVQAERILQECRAQGDTKNSLIEVTEGAGTYLAALDLGTVWACLGDDLVARKWYLQSFLENPTLYQVIFPLVSLLPKNSVFLKENIESRLIDAESYRNYAEVHSLWQLQDSLEIVNRVESLYGKSEITERARMACLRILGRDALYAEARQSNTELHWLLVGLFELENSDEGCARLALQHAGVRGEYIIKINDMLSQGHSGQWAMKMVTRDMIAMHTENLLTRWLPYAMDRNDAWLHLKYSPLGHILANIHWDGKTVQECEQNALRLFRMKSFQEAQSWIDKASQMGVTITQSILKCDIALACNDMNEARHVIYDAKKHFPDSEVIKNVSSILHPKVNPVALSRELEKIKTQKVVTVQ